MADGKVSFRWKDYAHGGKQRKMTVTAEEFLRRFLPHVLPRRFVRIRFSGFLANRCRKQLLPLCKQYWRLVRGNVPSLEIARQSRQQVGFARTAAALWCSLRNLPLHRSAGGLLTGRLSLTVRNRYSASILQRASACVLPVCTGRPGHLPCEAKRTIFNLPTVLMQPFWPQEDRCNTHRSGKPLSSEASKSIPYP